MKRRYFVYSTLMVGAAALLGCQVSPASLQGEQKGSMSVHIRKLDQRTVQARLNDVDHLIIGLQTADTTATKSIAAQEISNGSATTTFDTLKPGTASLSVEAFSATESIGLATASAQIKPLEITDVDINLILAPNYDNRGNIDLGIGLQDGPVVIVTPTPKPTPTPLG